MTTCTNISLWNRVPANIAHQKYRKEDIRKVKEQLVAEERAVVVRHCDYRLYVQSISSIAERPMRGTYEIVQDGDEDEEVDGQYQ
jgi:hypothetical protein